MNGNLLVYFEIRGYKTHYGETFCMILEDSQKIRRTLDMCWSETGWFIQLELNRQQDYLCKFQTQNAYSERCLHLQMEQYRDLERVKIYCDFAIKYHKIQAYNQIFNKLMKINNINYDQTPRTSGTMFVSLFVPFYPTCDTRVYLVGNDEEFGEWDYKNGIQLKPGEQSRTFYAANIPIRNDLQLQYKFVIQTPDGSVYWEACDNRILSYKDIEDYQHITLDTQFCYKTEDQQPLCPRFSGINLPLSSLHSRTIGFGDFKCLKQFITYSSQANIKMLQLLPLNDTNLNLSQYELSPYSSVSSFAINPVYLDAVSCLQTCVQRYNISEEFYNKMHFVTDEISQATQYSIVLQQKISFLKQIYEHIKDSEGFLKDISVFEQNNHYWIYGYATFKYIYEDNVCQEQNIEECISDSDEVKHNSHTVSQIKQLQQNSYQIRDFYGQNKQLLRFYTFQQFILDYQLKNVKQFAIKNGICLIGDLQASVPEVSADFFTFSNVFEQGSCFGAPPDFFSKEGQNWGLVLPKWESLEAIKWYRERVNYLTQYYDGIRVDHALGLCRLWKLIPGQPPSTGAMGYFVPSHRFTLHEIYESFRQEFKTSLDVNQFQKFFDDGFASVQAANKYTQLIDYLKQQNHVTIGQNTFSMGQSLHFSIDNEEELAQAAGLVSSQRKQLHELWLNRIFLKHPDNTYTPMPCNMFDETANEAFLFQKGVVGEFLRWRFIQPYFTDSASWREYREQYGKLSSILEQSGALIIAEDLGWITPMIYELFESKGFGGLQVGLIYDSQDYAKVREVSTHDMPSFAYQIKELKDKNGFQDLLTNINKEGTYGINIYQDYNRKLDFTDDELTDLASVEQLILSFLKAPNYINMVQIIDFMTFQNLNRLTQYEKQRINDPANPGPECWTWRLPVTLEQLSKNGFQDVWKKLLQSNQFFGQ